MFRNFIRTALRFLKQNKIFAAINALGLSIALAASFIILLYIINELSYNHCHKNRSRIYRVNNYYIDFKKVMSGTPYILASTLKSEYPQVEKAANTRYVRGLMLKVNNNFIGIPQAVGSTSDIFDIFSIKLLGSSLHDKLLDDPNSIVLSQNQANKIFPGTDPVGKDVTVLIGGEEHVFKITAVFEDLPVNSTFRADCFVNGKWTVPDISKTFKDVDASVSWVRDFWTTWILLSKEANAPELEKGFHAFEKKYLSENLPRNFRLQNLSDIYLKSDDVANTGVKGDISKVRLFSAIAFLIVLVAAINYIILSTAVSSRRAKEIGIRKTNGAARNSIMYQLSAESILLSVFVLPIALLLAWLALPYAGKLFQTRLIILGSNVFSYLSVYLVLTIFIGIASGVYTSYYLSGLRVIDILRNAVQYGNKKQIFRSGLIILQLVIFCSFVSSTFIIRSQYKYALNKDTGYYTKDVLFIELGRDFTGYPAFINSIKASPDVIMAAGIMDELPMQGSMSTPYPHYTDKEKKVILEGMAVDFNLLKTMGITLLEGRDFSEEFGSDLTKSVILNEKAVKQLGIPDPVGKILGSRTIIGVVKDFNLHSIHSDIPPMEIGMTDKYIMEVAVHYKTGSIDHLLPFLKNEWKKAAPGRSFYYSTIEDVISGIYSTEKNLTTIVTIFAFFTLLIAAFGLFGLTLFISRTRTKEIGIRKIFGSSERSIIFSFLKNNLILVVIAASVSVPVTLYFMTRWLSHFSSRTKIEWWIFAVSFLVSSFVVMLTVFFHSYRASRINPADALRYE
jgi:putative ABC transport system permease protein